MKMDYKKLGVFLITGIVICTVMTIGFSEDMPQFIDRLIFIEIIELIMWCFMGKEK